MPLGEQHDRPQQQLQGNGRERTQEDERPKRQMAGTASAVQGQQRGAVHPGQDECGEGARQQRLPADPAQRGADADGELGIPRPRPPGRMTARTR
jgi:hypothetical protein